MNLEQVEQFLKRLETYANEGDTEAYLSEERKLFREALFDILNRKVFPSFAEQAVFDYLKRTM